MNPFGQYTRQNTVIQYDFQEDFEFEAEYIDKNELVRPRRPISFTFQEAEGHRVKIEVYYKQGLYPQMICSCSQQTNCSHIQLLHTEIFPYMLELIYKKHGSSYNREYLKDEVAMKIRMISPLSERKILEDLVNQKQQKGSSLP
ncbi:MAG: hypothetical protein D6785_11395 [Planctomycetota bacterium]|nr:MAG: hypothetical protein D6785_11395 [Planctomycetota bacterium]